MTSIGCVAVGPFGVAVQVAPQVGQGDEVRQRAREGGLELARLLAQLRLDVRQADEGVGLGLGREGPQFGRVAGQRLAVLADPQEALLGQAPALVAGHRAEPDVVLLGAGEVDAVRPALARRDDHQVDLRTTAQPDRGLVAAAPEDLLDVADWPMNRSRIAGASGVSARMSRSPMDSRRRRNEPAGVSATTPGAMARSDSWPSTSLGGPVEQQTRRAGLDAGDAARI